ncbi:hypothetical protein A2U01_0069749, partial [Trifolium medium]|nr:hypothetical protein [Trifolium medium]
TSLPKISSLGLLCPDHSPGLPCSSTSARDFS